MPVRFDLSALSLRRSAKFALALSVAVVAITLATLTVQAWRTKKHFTAKRNSAAAQPTPAANVNYVRRTRLRPELRHLLYVVGDRLERPGK